MNSPKHDISSTQHLEVGTLSDETLDAVAGGRMNLFNPAVQAFLRGFASTAPSGTFWIVDGQGC